MTELAVRTEAGSEPTEATRAAKHGRLVMASYLQQEFGLHLPADVKWGQLMECYTLELGALCDEYTAQETTWEEPTLVAMVGDRNGALSDEEADAFRAKSPDRVRGVRMFDRSSRLPELSYGIQQFGRVEDDGDIVPQPFFVVKVARKIPHANDRVMTTYFLDSETVELESFDGALMPEVGPQLVDVLDALRHPETALAADRPTRFWLPDEREPRRIAEVIAQVNMLLRDLKASDAVEPWRLTGEDADAFVGAFVGDQPTTVGIYLGADALEMERVVIRNTGMVRTVIRLDRSGAVTGSFNLGDQVEHFPEERAASELLTVMRNFCIGMQVTLYPFMRSPQLQMRRPLDVCSPAEVEQLVNPNIRSLWDMADKEVE